MRPQFRIRNPSPRPPRRGTHCLATRVAPARPTAARLSPRRWVPPSRGNRFRRTEDEATVPDPEPIASTSPTWNPLPRHVGRRVGGPRRRNRLSPGGRPWRRAGRRCRRPRTRGRTRTSTVCSPMPGSIARRPGAAGRPAPQQRADLLEVAPVGRLVLGDPPELPVDRVVEDALAEPVAVHRPRPARPSSPDGAEPGHPVVGRRGGERRLEHRLGLAGHGVVGATPERCVGRGQRRRLGQRAQPRPRLGVGHAPAPASRRRRPRRCGSRARSRSGAASSSGPRDQLTVALEHAALEQHPGAQQARRHPLAAAARGAGVQAGQDAGGRDPAADHVDRDPRRRDRVVAGAADGPLEARSAPA